MDQLIADNDEHQAMVRKLEENIDASEGNAMGVDEVPSGDEIAAELEDSCGARNSERVRSRSRTSDGSQVEGKG